MMPRVNFINILHALILPKSFSQKITKPKCNREKLCKALLYKKHEGKMLMKLAPGVNFINVLQAAFFACRSQKRQKITDDLTVFWHFF